MRESIYERNTSFERKLIRYYNNRSCCVDIDGQFISSQIQEQQSPLHIAARLGNVDNVVLLLQHGALPDATTTDLYSPLHIAAKEGHEEVAQVLLDSGASIDLLTKVCIQLMVPVSCILQDYITLFPLYTFIAVKFKIFKLLHAK